ncbi:MAG: T9SS type A sorting domain-containing protein [Paludibacter sp.]|nr:T9SS type A sorting domain-containing protein [Paludibacter sp.]
MKKILFILCVGLIFVFTQRISAQADTVCVKTIKINLTKTGGTSGGNDWNDFTVFKADSTYALKDSTGTSITYTFYNEDVWDSQSTTNGVTGGPYPDPVCLSYWALMEKKTAEIELRNLNNNSLFYLEFYGARATTGSRVTDVTIGESMKSFQTCNNTSEKAIFKYVHPTDGVIRASIKMNETESDANWCYLGAIVLREYSLLTTAVNNLNQDRFSDLLFNSPNPFNGETKITYKVPVTGLVSMKVYDVAGREVVVLTNENKTEGEYSQSWDTSGLSSGVYFLRMSVKSDESTISVTSCRKVVKVK